LEAFFSGVFVSAVDSLFFLRRRGAASGSLSSLVVLAFAGCRREAAFAGACSSPSAGLADARRLRPGLAPSPPSALAPVEEVVSPVRSPFGVSPVVSSPAPARVALPRPRPPRRRRRRRGAAPPSVPGSVPAPAVASASASVLEAALLSSPVASCRGGRLRVRVPAEDPERLRVPAPEDDDAPFSFAGCAASSSDACDSACASDDAPCASPFEAAERAAPPRLRPRPPRRRRRRRGADSGAELPSDPVVTSAAVEAAGEAACSVPASLTKHPFRSGHARRGEGPAARRGLRKDRAARTLEQCDRVRSRERCPTCVLMHGNLASPSGPAAGAPASCGRRQPAAAWRVD